MTLAPHPADEWQSLALLLIAQQWDALHEVCSQDEVFDAEHLVDVELGVDEGHAGQVVVLQDPQEDLGGKHRGCYALRYTMMVASHKHLKECRAEFKRSRYSIRLLLLWCKSVWVCVWDLLSDGRHQVPVAVTESRHWPLLFLLIQHFELVLGERLAWLWHHFNYIQDQNLNTRITQEVVSRWVCFVFSSSLCAGVTCSSPGPCRWPPPPASDRSLLRCSPSVRTPSPDSSAPPSSYMSRAPTPPGRSLWRQ